MRQVGQNCISVPGAAAVRLAVLGWGGMRQQAWFMPAGVQHSGKRVRLMPGDTMVVILETLGRVEAGQAAMRAELGMLHDDQAAMRAEMTGVRGDVVTLRDDLTAVRGDLTAVRDDLTAVRGDMTAVRGDQAAMRADFATRADMLSMRAELMGRMDRLQDAVTAQQSDIAVNFGASDAVRRATENTREEVRGHYELLMILVRRVRVLERRLNDLAGGT